MKQYGSLGAFANHLQKLATTGHEVTHHMVKTGAGMIEKKAHDEIGTYQTNISPYPDWAPLAESTLHGWDSPWGVHYPGKIELGFAPPDNPLLRTGTMRDSIKSDAVGNEAVVGSNDAILKYHEFGTPKMPPRPVLGPAAHSTTNGILSRMAATTMHWLSGQGWKRQLRLK